MVWVWTYYIYVIYTDIYKIFWINYTRQKMVLWEKTSCFSLSLSFSLCVCVHIDRVASRAFRTNDKFYLALTIKTLKDIDDGRRTRKAKGGQSGRNACHWMKKKIATFRLYIVRVNRHVRIKVFCSTGSITLYFLINNRNVYRAR